jgi:hypothetical protein
VLPETELAAGLDDTLHLTECDGRVGHAAEEAHHDRGVEGSVGSRKRLGDALDDLDRHDRAFRPLSSLRAGIRIGLDGQDAGHGRRVVLKRAPVAGPDVDHAPAQAREQAAPELDAAGIRPARFPALQIPGEQRLLRPVQRWSGRAGGYERPRSMSSTR